jgi:hypothetical protein
VSCGHGRDLGLRFDAQLGFAKRRPRFRRARCRPGASVGIWPSGFRRSGSWEVSFCSHDAVTTMRQGAPMIASAASADADPEPFLP